MAIAVTADRASRTGGVVQKFQHGVVYASKVGTFAIGGQVYTRWTALHGASGSLGAPTSNLVSTSGFTGRYASFTGGVVAWSKSTGAHWMGTAVGKKWLKLHGATTRLGYPTTDQKKVRGGVQVTFKRGTITFATKGKKYTVTTR